MSMDYFRRPVLAGNNITRTTRATIRGSLRRTDADGTSTVPYFPGANTGQTLLVAVDGAAPTTVTLTSANPGGSSLAEALADINTALGLTGEAFDSDGTITIRSSNLTATASIQVTGGSAATALGFDVSLGKIRAVLGEELSTPEGRVKNPFGTAFPDKGENLSVESVNRSLARLAANADVLFSEHMRADALPKKLTYTTGDQKTLISTTPDSTRIFTGLGQLSASTTKEVLARFFFLVDQATGLPPASRVVGVVRGSPVGLPPYADATTWTGGGATGNVLGVDLTKSSIAISSIKNGKIITCAGASFITTAKVVPGDYVEIIGATNTVPWSNNGYRWVVEEVITETSLSVRPMSQSELVQFGPVTTEEHPITELNGATGVLGTAIVHTGTYCNDVKVIVDPPIPVGCTYDLYVSMPGDIRVKKVHEAQAKDILNSFSATNLRPEPDGLITPPTVSSWSAASVILTGGYARFAGRVVSIPARTFLAADFSTSNPNYVYWDKNTNDVYTTRSHVKVLNSDPAQSPGSGFPGDTQASQHLIAEVGKSGANITSVNYEGRAIAEEGEMRVVTVGTGGQFSKFEDAIHFVNRWAKGNNFRANTYPQYEIVIVSDTTIDFSTITNPPDYAANSIFIDCSVKIRGSRPDMPLRFSNYTAATPIDFGWSGGGTYILEDLTLYVDGTFGGVGLFNGRTGTTCLFKNVNLNQGAGGGTDVGAFGSFQGPLAIIDSCTIKNLKQGLIQFANAATIVEVHSSTIHMAVTPSTSPVLFGYPATPFAAKRLTVRDCEFHRLSTDQGYSGEALVGKFGHHTVFDGCSFERFGSNPAAQDSVLFKQQYVDGPLFINNCKSFHPTRCFIDSGLTQENYCVVSNNYIWVQPDAGNPGIRCGSFINNTVLGVGSVTQTLIEAMRECSGNFVSGSSAVAIKNSSAAFGSTFFTNIADNRIEVASGISIQVWTHNPNMGGVNVSGNQILVQGAGAIGIQTFNGLDLLNEGTISGNILRIRTGDGVSSKIGIYSKGSHSLIGNQVFLAAGETVTTVSHIGIKIDGAGSTIKAIGNNVSLNAGLYTSMTIEGTQPSATVIGNHLSSTGTALNFVGVSIGSSACVVSENYINGTVAGVTNLSAGRFLYNYVGGPVTSPATGISDLIEGNHFLGLVTINGTAARGLRVVGNVFTNNLTIGGAFVELSENTIAAGLTCSAACRAYENLFSSGSATISFLYSSFVIEKNVFSSNGLIVNILGFPAIVSGNQFLGNNLMVVTVGDYGGETGASTFFLDNYVLCTLNLLADYTVRLEVERNYIVGGTTIYEVDKFNNNHLSINGSSTVTGRRVEDALSVQGRAPAVGNVLYGGGAWTFTGMLFSGLSLKANAGTFALTDCEIAGGDIYTQGAVTTLTNCSITSCDITGISTWNLNKVRIVGSYFTSGGTITPTGGATGGAQIIGCRTAGALTIAISGANTDLMVEDSYINGGLTISGGSSDTDVTVSDCIVTGNASLAANKALNVSGCTFKGTGTHSLSGGDVAIIKGNQFDGFVSMTGFAQRQLFQGNRVSGGMNFTQDVSYPRWSVCDNEITSPAGVHGLDFPAFTFLSDSQIIINNNIILTGTLGGGSGTATYKSNIHFNGNAQHVSIVGNNLTIGNTTGDPGASFDGTYREGCIKVVGTGTNRHWTISSNTMNIPSSADPWLTYRTAALNITMYFWYFGSVADVGGAGNICETNVDVPNVAPKNGSQFFQDGAATPYAIS